jgi:DNA-binding NarL/FixJ family response regulator
MRLRSRLLLADDHAPTLESVSRHLGAAFDIVGTATGGREAVNLATRLRPDVAVLDVTMPDCDGFETLRQLRHGGLDTRIVFLTLHDDDDFAAAAVNAGAHGYVLKSRIQFDLISAIDHALAGRLFLPSLTSLSTVAGSRHTVLFHANDARYLDEVGRLAVATLRSGEPFVLATNEATRRGVAERLEARGMNVALLTERQQYVEQDSEHALSEVMRGGTLDRGRLAEMIAGLGRLRQAVPGRARSRLTLFGDMAIALCRDGKLETALELERIWNDLTHALPMFTVCSYPIACYLDAASRNLLSHMCGEHAAVVHARNFVHRSRKIH